MQRLAGLRGRVHGDFGSDARGGQHSVSRDSVMLGHADEIFAPLLDGAGFAVGLFNINPEKVGLEVAIGTGYGSVFDGEENVATVVGPVQLFFQGLVVG